MSFRVHREGELEYLTSDVLDGAAHCFSTRFGGVSERALASLNLGTHRGDRPENVLENYARLGRAVGFAPPDSSSMALPPTPVGRPPAPGSAGPCT